MNENQHQIAVFKWSKQAEVRGRYPELALMHHVANERQCSPAMGKLLKLMGVKPGVPDIDLPVARGKYHGLRIEMKTETGQTTVDQDWWGERLREQGYFVETCHGWESAIRVIEWYMGLEEYTK